MKNNRLVTPVLRSLGVVGLLAVIFVGNLCADPQQERAKQYQPGKYFVYEQGTSEGVLVDQALLDTNSEMIKGRIRFQGRPQEIPLPFSLDDIKLTFNVLNKKINAEKLSFDQLSSVIKGYDYLGVDVFNDNLINAIVARVNDIGDKIMKNVLDLDVGNTVMIVTDVIPDYTVFGMISDSNVVKKIVDKVLLTPNNFCQKFTNFIYRSDNVQRIFQNDRRSIVAVLDKVKKTVAHWNKDAASFLAEERSKWFWQR
jgi:hypothetical protein